MGLSLPLEVIQGECFQGDRETVVESGVEWWRMVVRFWNCGCGGGSDLYYLFLIFLTFLSLAQRLQGMIGWGFETAPTR